MPLQATSGAASYDAFGGGAATAANYIEDMFQTWLYTGNGTTQTIINGIDLAGKGGLVWAKKRSGADPHYLYDTVRGANKDLSTNDTGAEETFSNALSFNANGFTVGHPRTNADGDTFASWTFREQPKFFDVVTYTGDGTANRNVTHALGAAPGFVIIKRTSGSSNWNAAARLNNGDASFMMLNRTVGQTSASASWFNSTTFKVGTSDWPSSTGSPDFFGYDTNGTGDTYVAYLFAHNAGGFGLTGTDNVISCGSFTTNTSGNASVTLGYEPQWVLTKRVDTAGNWVINDNMRGMPASQTSQVLYPNLSNAESSSIFFSTQPNATGFTTQNYANTSFDGVAATVIYIAIRRGPMKVPTTGTSVFAPVARTGTQTNNTTVGGAGFAPDLVMAQNRAGITGNGGIFFDKLRGAGQFLNSASTSAEGSAGNSSLNGFTNNGFTTNADATAGYINFATTYANWLFGRAPGFFDEVCYTGTGVARTVAHNLAAVPELMIVKRRDTTGNWNVYSAALGATQYILLNSDYYALPATSLWNDTAPTSSVFTVGTFGGVNASGGNYVAYLFATCAGVSKVGSYTGTGTTQTINCGFTGGARFVMIKRTDFDGDWYVWDSARGIVAGNDPYLLLNSTAAEVTSTDWVDTAATGFELSSTAPAALNASGGSYIFLAIA